jgi:hypothetical protein
VNSQIDFGLATHSGTFFWMRELRSSVQTKVQQTLNRGQLAGRVQEANGRGYETCRIAKLKMYPK